MKVYLLMCDYEDGLFNGIGTEVINVYETKEKAKVAKCKREHLEYKYGWIKYYIVEREVL